MSDHAELIDTVPSESAKTGAVNNPEVDSIWLTRPSIKPLVLAVAFALTLIGLFGWRPLMIFGLVLALCVTITWITDSRDESDELPLG